MVIEKQMRKRDKNHQDEELFPDKSKVIHAIFVTNQDILAMIVLSLLLGKEKRNERKETEVMLIKVPY